MRKYTDAEYQLVFDRIFDKEKSFLKLDDLNAEAKDRMMNSMLGSSILLGEGFKALGKAIQKAVEVATKNVRDYFKEVA